MPMKFIMSPFEEDTTTLPYVLNFHSKLDFWNAIVLACEEFPGLQARIVTLLEEVHTPDLTTRFPPMPQNHFEAHVPILQKPPATPPTSSPPVLDDSDSEDSDSEPIPLPTPKHTDTRSATAQLRISSQEMEKRAICKARMEVADSEKALQSLIMQQSTQDISAEAAAAARMGIQIELMWKEDALQILILKQQRVAHGHDNETVSSELLLRNHYEEMQDNQHMKDKKAIDEIRKTEQKAGREQIPSSIGYQAQFSTIQNPQRSTCDIDTDDEEYLESIKEDFAREAARFRAAQALENSYFEFQREQMACKEENTYDMEPSGAGLFGSPPQATYAQGLKRNLLAESDEAIAAKRMKYATTSSDISSRKYPSWKGSCKQCKKRITHQDLGAACRWHPGKKQYKKDRRPENWEEMEPSLIFSTKWEVEWACCSKEAMGVGCTVTEHEPMSDMLAWEWNDVRMLKHDGEHELATEKAIELELQM